MIKAIRRFFAKLANPNGDRMIAGRRNFLKVASAIVLAPLLPAPVINAKRELKTAWTLGPALDLKSQHNLEAKAELTACLVREIMEEIDREIMNDLRLAADGQSKPWIRRMAA